MEISKNLKGKMGIYKILNTVNGRMYVGSSKNLYNRGSDHLCELRGNRHINKRLQNAYNKYGEDSFIFEAIEYIDNVEEQYVREQYWLDTFDCVKNGYNINPDAIKPPDSKGKNNPMYGKHHTEESRRKMSLNKIGTQANGNNPRALSIICLDDGKIFDTVKQCSEYYNLDKSGVRKNTQGVYINPNKHFMLVKDFIGVLVAILIYNNG